MTINLHRLPVGESGWVFATRDQRLADLAAPLLALAAEDTRHGRLNLYVDEVAAGEYIASLPWRSQPCHHAEYGAEHYRACIAHYMGALSAAIDQLMPRACASPERYAVMSPRQAEALRLSEHPIASEIAMACEAYHSQGEPRPYWWATDRPMTLADLLRSVADAGASRTWIGLDAPAYRFADAPNIDIVAYARVRLSERASASAVSGGGPH